MSAALGGSLVPRGRTCSPTRDERRRHRGGDRRPSEGATRKHDDGVRDHLRRDRSGRWCRGLEGRLGLRAASVVLCACCDPRRNRRCDFGVRRCVVERHRTAEPQERRLCPVRKLRSITSARSWPRSRPSRALGNRSPLWLHAGTRAGGLNEAGREALLKYILVQPSRRSASPKVPPALCVRLPKLQQLSSRRTLSMRRPRTLSGHLKPG